jgi:hypothetical protein
MTIEFGEVHKCEGWRYGLLVDKAIMAFGLKSEISVEQGVWKFFNMASGQLILGIFDLSHCLRHDWPFFLAGSPQEGLKMVDGCCSWK